MPGKVLIAGASGLVGAAAIDRFAAAGWPVVAVSRRRPETETDAAFEHLAVDLSDPAACRAAFGARRDVTHVVYTAVSETPGLMPGWRDPANIERNKKFEKASKSCQSILTSAFRPPAGAGGSTTTGSA